MGRRKNPPCPQMAANLSRGIEMAGFQLRAEFYRAMESWVRRQEVLKVYLPLPSSSGFYGWVAKGNAPKGGQLRLVCAFLRHGRRQGQVTRREIQHLDDMMDDLPKLVPSEFAARYFGRAGIAQPAPAGPRTAMAKGASNRRGAPKAAPVGELMKVAIDAVSQAQHKISRAIKQAANNVDHAEYLYGRMLAHPDTARSKMSTRFDQIVESHVRECFDSRFPDVVHVRGEEEIGAAWNRRTCVLVDGVDGSDMVEMSLPLWCSAVTLYDSHLSRIIGAAVALPSGEVYYARDGETPMVRIQRRAPRPLHGPSKIRSLNDARVGYYGQKTFNFLGVTAQPRLLARLRSLSSTGKGPGLRLYNFAGNPFIVRIADRLGHGRVRDGFDAVFDISGQKPHDFLPACFIALRGGAHMCTTGGKAISLKDLADCAASPEAGALPYTIAGTRPLAEELSSLLDPKLKRRG